MKRLLIALVAVISMIAMHAADDYLHIRTSEGWKVLNINEIDRLIFTDGTMVAKDKDEKVLLNIPREALQTLLVNDQAEPETDPTETPEDPKEDPDDSGDDNGDDNTTGIDSVDSENGTDRSFEYDATTRKVTMLKDGSLEIYRIDGARLTALPYVRSGEVIDIAAVGHNIVILKSGKYTLKVAVL